MSIVATILGVIAIAAVVFLALVTIVGCIDLVRFWGRGKAGDNGIKITAIACLIIGIAGFTTLAVLLFAAA